MAAVGAAVILMAVTAACGGGGGGDKEESSPTSGRTGTTFHGDPNRVCNIITKADVEAALGSPVAAGQGTSGAACRYTSSSGGEDQAVLVLLTDEPNNKEIFDRTTSARGMEPLPGVGDKAFINKGGQGVQAFVLKGNKIVVVVLNLDRPAQALSDAATKLAQTAATKA